MAARPTASHSFRFGLASRESSQRYSRRTDPERSTEQKPTHHFELRYFHSHAKNQKLDPLIMSRFQLTIDFSPELHDRLTVLARRWKCPPENALKFILLHADMLNGYSLGDTGLETLKERLRLFEECVQAAKEARQLSGQLDANPKDALESLAEIASKAKDLQEAVLKTLNLADIYYLKQIQVLLNWLPEMIHARNIKSWTLIDPKAIKAQLEITAGLELLQRLLVSLGMTEDNAAMVIAGREINFAPEPKGQPVKDPSGLREPPVKGDG